MYCPYVVYKKEERSSEYKLLANYINFFEHILILFVFFAQPPPLHDNSVTVHATMNEEISRKRYCITKLKLL